jgi:hypothetical protein
MELHNRSFQSNGSVYFLTNPKLDFAHFRAPVSDGGPKDRRFRDDAHGLFDR